MRSIATIAAAALMAVGIGSAQAAPVTFKTVLGPEVSGATGSGTATVVIDTVLNTLFIQTTWTGLSGNTTVAHIHCCTAIPGVGTVGVAVTPSTLPGFPVGIKAGNYSVSLATDNASTYTNTFVSNFGGGTLAGAEAALLAGLFSGSAYLNIHSGTFPAGEIRGFLTAVPEPATLTLLGAGLVGLGLARRATRRAA